MKAFKTEIDNFFFTFF